MYQLSCLYPKVNDFGCNCNKQPHYSEFHRIRFSRMDNIKNLSIEVIVPDCPSSHKSGQLWALYEVMGFTCSRADNFTIRYIVQPNISPEGDCIVCRDTDTYRVVRNMYRNGNIHMLGDMPHTADALKNRSKKTVTLDLLCPHGPWISGGHKSHVFYEDV